MDRDKLEALERVPPLSPVSSVVKNLNLPASLRRATALTALLLSSATEAGPPFRTDDPEPTDTGRWEIYAPLIEIEGIGKTYDGAFGLEINYGATKDVQVTAGLAVAFTHDEAGSRSGIGDVKASVKYRFYHNEAAGLQIAVFPGITLPTASNGMGAGQVTALLPVWGQKDFGNWSIFGGGGLAINPGAGNQDYWTGGVAVTHRFTKQLVIGLEFDRQGPTTIQGRASTSLGIGAIYNLPGPFRLLASGGPSMEDGGTTGYHAFMAFGLDF